MEGGGEKPPSNLDLIAKMMKEHPEMALQFIEKEITEDMLGTYSLDFMKRLEPELKNCLGVCHHVHSFAVMRRRRRGQR